MSTHQHHHTHNYGLGTLLSTWYWRFWIIMGAWIAVVLVFTYWWVAVLVLGVVTYLVLTKVRSKERHPR